MTDHLAKFVLMRRGWEGSNWEDAYKKVVEEIVIVL